MAVSVRMLLEGVKNIKDIRVMAGDDGLDNTVRMVHVVEGLAISSFLEGDEIIFTTGIALKDENELLELARHSFAQGAACMVINTGPYIEKVPESVLLFADSNAFPVISVPWQVHLPEIMRSFTLQINMEELKESEMCAAFRNAFFMPKNTQLYIPVLKKYGYKSEWSYCVCTIEIISAKTHSHDLALTRRVMKLIGAGMWDMRPHTVMLEESYGICMVLCNISQETLKMRMSEINDIIVTNFSGMLSFYIGAGSIAGSINDIAQSYAQAEQTKQLQKKRGNKNTFMTYQELGLYKLLFALEQTGLLEEYYSQTLAILEKYDIINETDYLYFLQKFFELDFSIAETARVMHMHRNSVAYKLHRIEEIMGISVSAPKERTRLMIAFMIREIM